MPHIATPVAGSSGASTASVSGLSFSFLSAVPTGHTLIGAVNVTENTTQPGVTVTDSKGNTYTVDGEVTSGTTDVTVVFSTLVTTALTTSDTITVTFSDTHTRWAISVEEFDDILSARLDQTATGSGVGTAMTTSATGTTTAANELVFGGFGFTTPSGKTFTPQAGFSNSAIQGTTVGTADRAVCNEWRYINTIGAQTVSATLNVSSTWAAVAATYKVAPTGIQELGLLGVG